MARRKKRKIRRRPRRTKQKNALDYIKFPKAPKMNLKLRAETKKSILIIMIGLFGIISFLSLFGLAGAAGEFLERSMSLVLGAGKWFLPILLVVSAFLLYNQGKYIIKGASFLGIFLFVVSWQSLMHFFLEPEIWEKAASEGRGGGYLGLFLASVFYKIIGFWGSLIVIIALLFIALLLLFNTSLQKLIGGESIFAKISAPVFSLLKRIFKREPRQEYAREDSDEEIFEEEVEPEPAFAHSNVGEGEESDAEEEEFEQVKISSAPATPAKAKSGWQATNIKINLPLDLLNSKIGKPTGGDIKNNSLIIQKTLENFGISVEMGEVSVGPTVTQYTFKPAQGVKLARITTLSNDLALALAAHPIRIEAPIPGKPLVGIEVPNQSTAVVPLREVLDAPEFKKRESNLLLALGKDVAGKTWLYDLAKMPHLLVAGATNSGKSVALNAIIMSLLYQNDPDDLRFIMVDPKRVELPVYNGIPHLLTPVITDVSKTINSLKWCLNEMDRRFEVLSRHGKRNIQTYNKSAKEKMPYIVFVIDELADLMVVAAKEVEAGIIRLAQMARAVGIHLILATQRPSVDVITGLIKANMPARIAFSVASGVDSKTILDSLGAERLLGKGDMLFVTADLSKPKRLQGALVTDLEIKKVTNYIKEKSGDFEYMEGVTDKQKVSAMGGMGMTGGSDDGDYDDRLEEAKETVIQMQKASASLLQRKLSVGYSRAARILDELEEVGVVGQANGSKPREVLVTKEQFEASQNQPTAGANLHSRQDSQAPGNYLDEEDEDDDEDDNDMPPVFDKEEDEEVESKKETSGDSTVEPLEEDDDEEGKEEQGEEEVKKDEDKKLGDFEKFFSK